MERRDAPDNLVGGMIAGFGGALADSLDGAPALAGDLAFWSLPPAKPRGAAELDAGDGREDEPARSEEIALSDLFSDYTSRRAARPASDAGAQTEPGRESGLDWSPWALTLGDEWDGGLPDLFMGSGAPALSQPFVSADVPPPSHAGISLPANFAPRLSAPVAPTAAARDSSNITDLSRAVAASSFGSGAYVSAYVASTFPDGRIMDDGLPPGSGPALGDGSDGMVISQVYAAGGEVGSQYRQDYVELFNRGDAPIDLSGWSVQYADAQSGAWQVIALSGSVAAGQYYLVWGASGTEGLGDAPNPDATGAGVNLVADAGKVALVDTTTALIGAVPFDPSIVDFVGYGDADAAEGSGAAPATDLTVAALRDNGGLNDTDDNYYDFSADTPAPRNTSSPLANRPPVNTVPGPQTTPQDTALTFSAANGNALSIADPDAGGSAVEVWLSAADGALTLATTAGLTFTEGDGGADAEMAFSGTISAINTALDGLSFAPAAGFVGPAVVGIVTDDLGNTGAGGARHDIDAVLVAVGGPLVAIDDAFSTWEDTATDIDVLANDAFVHGDELYLEIVTGPSNGDAWVNGNGTPETFDDFLTYDPDWEFHGADSLTYRVSDDHSNYATATVALTTVSINDARIAVPPDQAAAENEFVSLQIQTPDRSAGTALTFSATGLPDGLNINPTSGLISGWPPYDAAQVNDGVYNVTVTASGAGDSDSRSFVWYINDTNRVALIDDQVSRAGQFVFFQVDVPDVGTFSATGLPPGLMINPSDGTIFGTVSTPPTPGVTKYTTTYSFTGTNDGYTDSRTFTWNVLSGNDPIVLLAINDTLFHEDDITLLEPTPLPLTVRVILYAPGTVGAQSVSLSVPSGRSSLSTSTLLLSDGQSATVTMTPQQVSAADDDVVLLAFVGGQQRGEGKAVNMQKIEIKTGNNVNKIRAANTPEGMADRIPPWAKTPYTVVFKGPQVEKTMIVAEFGHSADHGDVALVHPPTGELYTAIRVTPAMVNFEYNAQLQGQKQTKPGQGNAGQLWVGVFRDGEHTDPAKVLKKTAGFSVAAIPVKVEMSNPSTLGGKDKSKPVEKEYFISWGVIWDVKHTSDSGRLEDLDQVEISEKIETRQENPKPTNVAIKFLKGIRAGGFLPASETPWNDTNAYGPPVPKELAGERVPEILARFSSASVFQEDVDKEGNGVGYVDQYFVFFDKRTNMTKDNAKVINESGFAIRYTFEKQAGKYYVRVKKTAYANHGAQGGIIAQADTEEKSDEVVKPKID